MPCVAYNEKEDSLVSFHGEDVLVEGHDSSLDKLDEVLGAFEIRAPCRALVRQLVVRVSFCTEGHGGTNLDSRVDQIPNTWTRDLSLEDLLQHCSHVDTGNGQAITLCEMSLTEKKPSTCVAQVCCSTLH